MLLDQVYISSWPLIGSPCPRYRPVTPSQWLRPYSSPVSSTPCWRGLPPPGTKPDSGLYKANIYNRDIYNICNNSIHVLYVSIRCSALRVSNICAFPQVGISCPIKDIWTPSVSPHILSELSFFEFSRTQLSHLVTCSHRDGACSQPRTDSHVPHSVRHQVSRPPGESLGTSYRRSSDSNLQVLNTGVRQTSTSEHKDTCIK